MLLLRTDRTPDTDRPVNILLLGRGLIGRATERAICRSGYSLHANWPLDWADGGQRRRQWQSGCLPLLSEEPEAATALVWCAGKSGFADSSEALAGELSALQQTLTWTMEAVERQHCRFHSLHLLSSAGGLFEGQSHVQRHTPPSPARPYGRGKQEQENWCRRLIAEKRLFIYRPSSVYGFTRYSQRIGLISALLGNALRFQETVLEGRGESLRDYVLADDVGFDIARQVMRGPNSVSERTRLLAAGRPSSLREINHHVAAVIGRRTHVRFRLGEGNTSNITFAPDAIPADWRPTDLLTGIRSVARRMRKYRFDPA